MTSKGPISTAKEGAAQSTKDGGGQISTKGSTKESAKISTKGSTKDATAAGGSKVAGSAVQAVNTSKSGGGGGADGSQKKKAIVNLGTYEEMDAPSTKKKTAVNRNAYEIIGGGGGDDGYVLLNKENQATEEAGIDDEPSDKSDRSLRRQQRHLRRLQEEEELMGRTRMVVVFCTALIGLIVVIALITAGVVIILKGIEEAELKKSKAAKEAMEAKETTKAPKPPYRPKPSSKKLNIYDGMVSYGFDECKAYWVERLFNTSEYINASFCMIVKPLLHEHIKHKCVSMKCDIHIIWPYGQVWTSNMGIYGHNRTGPRFVFNPTMQTRHDSKINASDGFFCHHQNFDSADKINKDQRHALVCDNGVCEKKVYGNTSEAYKWNEEKGKWVDSCDRFACIDDKPADIDPLKPFFPEVQRIDAIPAFNRINCLDADESSCTNDMNAVVYLQRMMCDMNSDNVGDFCEFGMPSPDRNTNDPPAFRLFKCHDCLNNQRPQDLATFDDVRTDACRKYAREVFESEGMVRANDVYNWTMNKIENNCTILCDDHNPIRTQQKQRRILLPDGTSCGDPETPKVERYCLQGACIYWDPALGKSEVEPMDKCEENLQAFFKKRSERRFPKKSEIPTKG